jgi:hypothetical protein
MIKIIKYYYDFKKMKLSQIHYHFKYIKLIQNYCQYLIIHFNLNLNKMLNFNHLIIFYFNYFDNN